MGAQHDHSHNQHEPHSGHSHGHHHHAPSSHGKVVALAVTLNALFVVAETAASFISGSTALLADVGHNLGDVLSLLLAWGASVLAARPAGPGYTYGLKSSSILAATANAALLWVAKMHMERPGPDGTPMKLDVTVLTADIWVQSEGAWLLKSSNQKDISVAKAGKVVFHQAK